MVGKSMSAFFQLAEREVWATLCVGFALLCLFLAFRLYGIRRHRRADDAALWSLLDAVPFPVWRRSPDFSIAAANLAYLEMVQGERDELPAQHLEIGGRQHHEDRLAMARRATQAGMALSESQYVVVDGARRLLEITEMPLRNQVAGLLGYALDRTSLEEVQAALSQHISAHGEVLEVLRAGIAIFSVDRRLRFFNTAFAELWRIEDADLAGEPRLDEVLTLLQDRRRFPEQIDFPAYKEQQNRLFTSLLEPDEGLLHLPDDRTLRFIVSPHPLGGLLFVYEDVTDRMALERSHNTLIDVQRATLDNLRQSVAVFGGDGRLRLWNPPFETLWGYPRALLDDAPHISDLVNNVIRALIDVPSPSGSLRDTLIIQITEPILKTGQLELRNNVVLDYSIVPLPDGGCMVTYLDVTDTTRVQRALEERAQALENADRVKSEFIANISYELRTPLNAIIGFTDFLSHQIVGDLNQKQSDYVDYIMSASNQLLTLIDDILDLATIEAGYLELHRENVDIKPLLEGLVEVMGERAEKGGVSINLDCSRDLGMIKVDATRLRQAIFNLMSNAVKFTPDGGAVRLSARRNGSDVIIIVADTGIGFDLDNKDRLFEKFEVGNSKSRDSGPGLGLALTKSLIELHGGSVEMQSIPSEGTTATCRIPIEPAVDQTEASLTP